MGKTTGLKKIHRLPDLPLRPADGHKGLFGRVLVVGGQEEMLGAPVLAGTAALRIGAGLVQIAVPRAILPFCLSKTPELIGLALDDHSQPRLREAAEKADSIVVGPGMGQSTAARARLEMLIGIDKPMVIDADALNMIAAGGQWPADFKARAVLTPHPGEMARLGKLLGCDAVATDDAGRVQLAAQAAQTFKQVIVLKGHRTVVCDGERYHLNTTGDSTLSKAGAGDVLSGILGCLLAQMQDPFEAAQLAVFIHGIAGQARGKEFGRRSALATDIINALVPTLQMIEATPARKGSPPGSGSSAPGSRRSGRSRRR